MAEPVQKVTGREEEKRTRERRKRGGQREIKGHEKRNRQEKQWFPCLCCWLISSHLSLSLSSYRIIWQESYAMPSFLHVMVQSFFVSLSRLLPTPVLSSAHHTAMDPESQSMCWPEFHTLCQGRHIDFASLYAFLCYILYWSKHVT